MKRFLTVRDKTEHGSHRRSKSSDNQKAPIFTPEKFFGMFKNKNGSKSDEAVAQARAEKIKQELAARGLPMATPECIRFALESNYAEGDDEKAIEMIQIFQKSLDGEIVPYDPKVKMLGAENREAVTCYLDSLLFAMYAKLDAFECMLKSQNGETDQTQRELASFVRLWVNLLRTGKLIHVDLTEKLQEALAACGWPDAARMEQQDTSEAFAFIADKLQLPLLSLQMDLFHEGKEDKDDHKKLEERLLNLAMPDDPEGKGVALEDALEEYLNTRVDVTRYEITDEKRPRAHSASSRADTLRLDVPDEAPNGVLSSSPTQLNVPSPDTESSGMSRSFESPTMSRLKRPQNRARSSTGVIRRVLIDEHGNATEPDDDTLMRRAQRQGSQVSKAVVVPAWQFFKFIAWSGDSATEPKSNAEVAQEFNRRLMIGICLKRYTVDAHGPKRLNTYIDIPESIRIPRFMILDQEGQALSSDYKLVLQSVICHRGDSVQSGHYVAYARMDSKQLTENRRHDNDPPPDYEEAQWARFDDLHEQERVTLVDDFKQALKQDEGMPYLLFYRVMPLIDVDASPEDATTKLPSYTDTTDSTAVAATPEQKPVKSRPSSSYFDESTLAASTAHSLRLSSEVERLPRLSLNDEEFDYRRELGSLNGSLDNSRRGSEAQNDASKLGAAASSEIATSPAVSPGEETTKERLSRAAARFKTGASRGSRPSSQVATDRITSTMSKLGFKTGKSKDPLKEDAAAADKSNGHAISDHKVLAVPSSGSEEPRKSIDEEGKKKEKKGWGKSKEKEKEKDKQKDLEKTKEKGDVPDRECTVM